MSRYSTACPGSGRDGAALSFWYHYYGSNLGTLEIQVAACGDSWTTVHTISTANTTSLNAWRQVTVALPAATNTQIRFKAIRGPGSNDWSGDIAIDDVSLTTPPRVTAVNSVNNTGDGTVLEAEAIDVSVTQLLLTFDQDMANPAGDSSNNDVTNPSGYLLYEDGDNDTFNTVNCAGGIVSDDLQITIDSVNYNAGTRTDSGADDSAVA